MASFNWPPSGSGDLSGPGSATDNAVARFDGTTGGIIQNSAVTLSDAGAFAGAIIDADTNTVSNIKNADIKAAAAIALNKLAATTASRALQSDASGFVSASGVTSTELSYVSGVTSAIQTQLNAKLNLAGGTMTGDLTLAGDPDSALKAATKQYVDSLAAGLDVKASVLVLSASDITLSGEQTIDGVLTSSSRVLVAGQSAQAENGIYLTDAGAWSRVSDMDNWAEVPGAFVFVEEGSTYANTGWVCTADAGGTLETTAITWSQFSGAGTYTADGQGIELTGTQYSLELDGASLSKSASGLKFAVGAAYRLVVRSVAGEVTDHSALTASRALATDANGLPTASATTATELGYLNGVTSAIQTQINSVQSQIDAIRAAKGNVSVSSDVTLTDQRLHFVNTSAARSLELPSAAATVFVILKDVTGSAQTNPITITTAGAETVDGGSTYTIDWNYAALTFVSDGTNYFVL